MDTPNSLEPPRDCPHNWTPVSFAFETQLLDSNGRVRVRQPDTEHGRVYFICTGCASHTYMSTSWVGYRMLGAEDSGDGLDFDGYAADHDKTHDTKGEKHD